MASLRGLILKHERIDVEYRGELIKIGYAPETYFTGEFEDAFEVNAVSVAPDAPAEVRRAAEKRQRRESVEKTEQFLLKLLVWWDLKEEDADPEPMPINGESLKKLSTLLKNALTMAIMQDITRPKPEPAATSSPTSSPGSPATENGAVDPTGMSSFAQPVGYINHPG